MPEIDGQKISVTIALRRVGGEKFDASGLSVVEAAWLLNALSQGLAFYESIQVTMEKETK